MFPPRRTGHVQPLNDDDLMTKVHAQPLDDDDLFIQDNNNNFYQEKQDPMYQDKDFRAQPRTTPGLGQNRTTPDIGQGPRKRNEMDRRRSNVVGQESPLNHRKKASGTFDQRQGVMQRGEEIQDEEGRPREGFTKDQERRNDNFQGTRYWRGRGIKTKRDK